MAQYDLTPFASIGEKLRTLFIDPIHTHSGLLLLKLIQSY